MKHLILLFSFIFLLSACNKSENPEVVADNYWKSVHANKLKEAAALALKDSDTAIKNHQKSLRNLKELRSGQVTTTVKTTITNVDKETNDEHKITFDTVLVFQEGQWKVDANNTKVPATLNTQDAKLQKFADELSKNVEQNLKSIDHSMGEGLNILNEVLEESSKEIGTTFQEALKGLSQSMKESIENMKQQRALQKQQKQQQKNSPTPKQNMGEGAI